MGTETGRVGAEDLVGGVNTTIFTVPTGVRGTLEVSINICNRNAKTIEYRLAILDGAVDTLEAEDYIEYDIELETKGVVRSCGHLMALGDVLVAYSDTSGVTVQASAKRVTANVV
ncbi:hypothetical protein KAR91_34420 [Candidatus Pacearchaeota archaeon]|nr:hypothetical protein [Candidatus Pacearchaeota archaeon]